MQRYGIFYRTFLFFILTVLLSGCSLNSLSGSAVPLTADQDLTLPSLTLNGCTFHLETMGDPGNPPVLFLHGGVTDYKSFLGLTERVGGRSLVDDYFLIFYDQRGKGLSQRFDDRNQVTFSNYLKDMEAIINDLCGTRPVVFVAHSFGGTFTAQYMNAHPDRVAGAVLIEPGTISTQHRPQEFTIDYSSEWISDLMWSQQMFDLTDHVGADLQFAITISQYFNPEAHTRLRPPFWRVGAAAQYWLTMELRDSEFNFAQNLGLISCEVLFLAGSQTEHLGVNYQMGNMSFFPDARMEIIPGAGHCDLIWADRTVVIPAIINYLDSLNL